MAGEPLGLGYPDASKNVVKTKSDEFFKTREGTRVS